MNEIIEPDFIKKMSNENPKITEDWMVKIETGEVYAATSLENYLPENKDYLVFSLRRKNNIEGQYYRLF